MYVLLCSIDCVKLSSDHCIITYDLFGRKMVIQMHPDPQELVELIRSLITDKDHKDWGWSNFFIVYESDEGRYFVALLANDCVGHHCFSCLQ